ncbi:MAG: hypothetical protein HZA54_12595, partial [Planctomycetes bacterium]|nr:hypothetical protein [Planctomycetota bacterium]
MPMDAGGQDRRLGQLALRQAGVSPDQLAECLAEQQASRVPGAPAPRLGALLLRQGYLTDATLGALLEAQGAAPDPAPSDAPDAQAEDSRFGRRLEAHGLATADEIADALRVQNLLAANGIHVRLGEILVSRSVLTTSQVRDALALQDKTVLNCPRCAQAFNVRGHVPGRDVPCPVCHGPLILPPLGGTIRVSGSAPALAPVRLGPKPDPRPAAPAPASTLRRPPDHPAKPAVTLRATPADTAPADSPAPPADAAHAPTLCLPPAAGAAPAPSARAPGA